MWLGTRLNIWKTHTYLNKLKWVFCSRHQAGLPVTSACFEEGRESFLQALIQIVKVMFCFDFNSLKKRVYCRIFFLHCLFEFYMFFKGQRQSHLQAVYQIAQVLTISPASKTWFHSLAVQIMYSACITHCFVVLVVFSYLCLPSP